MPRYAVVETGTWRDEKFRSLSLLEKVFWMYLLSCPHSNLIGLFYLPPGYIYTDFQGEISIEDIEKLLKKFCNLDMVMYDWKMHILFVKNFLQHNHITNPNQFKAAKKELIKLPKTNLLATFAEHNQDIMPKILGLSHENREGNQAPAPVIIPTEQQPDEAPLKDGKEKIDELIKSISKDKEIPAIDFKAREARKALLREQINQLAGEKKDDIGN